MSSDFRFELKFSASRFDILKYNYLHIWWILLLDIIGLLAFFIIAYWAIFHPVPAYRETLGIILFWFTLLLAFGFSQPLILFLQIYIFETPQVKGLLEPRSYIFGEKAIEIDSGVRLVTVGWNKIIRLRKIAGLILLYTGPRLAYVIPGRIFKSGSEFAAFWSYISHKIKTPPAEPGGEEK